MRETEVFITSQTFGARMINSLCDGMCNSSRFYTSESHHSLLECQCKETKEVQEENMKLLQHIGCQRCTVTLTITFSDKQHPCNCPPCQRTAQISPKSHKTSYVNKARSQSVIRARKHIPSKLNCLPELFSGKFVQSCRFVLASAALINSSRALLT